jgi:hypothetical protein
MSQRYPNIYVCRTGPLDRIGLPGKRRESRWNLQYPDSDRILPLCNIIPT